jgi:hypothetical protein
MKRKKQDHEGVKYFKDYKWDIMHLPWAKFIINIRGHVQVCCVIY